MDRDWDRKDTKVMCGAEHTGGFVHPMGPGHMAQQWRPCAPALAYAACAVLCTTCCSLIRAVVPAMARVA